MSNRRDRTAEERAVQELLRSVQDPEPTSEFHDRLRSEWLSAPANEISGRIPRASVLPFAPVGLALAAAAVLAVLFFALNRAPAWEFAGVTGEGRIVVDEEVVSASDAAATLPGLLRPGATIHLDDQTQLDLAAPEILAIQMAPGSNLTIPDAPGRWLGRTISGSVTHGEVRFVTGPRFEGMRLTIEAPSARIHATGTTFAVIASPCSTCVCVLEGEVRMEEESGAAEVVDAGRRRTIFAQRDEILDEDIFPMERMKLEMLRDQIEGTGTR